MAATADQSKKSPSEFLKHVIGQNVIVKLNSGVDYRGFSDKFGSISCILNAFLKQIRSPGLS